MEKNTKDLDRPFLSELREVEESEVEGGAPDQELFFQVKLNTLTNALLVPAHMISAKLNPSSAPNTQVAGADSVSVSSTNGDDVALDRSTTSELASPEFNNNSNNNNGNTTSNNNNNTNCSSSVAVRYHPYHSTLRAAVLTAPDNTFYTEGTFIIGSVGQRRALLAADPQPQESGQRTPKNTSFLCADGGDTAKKSSSSTARSSPLLAPLALPVDRQAELECTPTTRTGVTFHVRKPSKIMYGVDTTDDGVSLDAMRQSDGLSAKKKKKKNVRFPENVIKSVSVVEAEDQLRLLVEYNRPWYAYFVLLVASAFFVLGWSFVARGVMLSSTSARVASAAVNSFVAFGFASVYLLVFLAFVWRPGREEREALADFSQNRPVLYVLLAGVVSQFSIVCAFMLTACSVSLVCFCCCPLVLTYTYEEYKKHSVSFLDAAGCVLVVCSFVVFAAGLEIANTQELYRVIVPVLTAIIGGSAMAFFLFQVRTVSQHVSNLFIMTSTLMLTTLLLAFVSYITGGFTDPIGVSQKSLPNISSADFLNMILGALFIFLSWFTYHWSSLFFDRMTLSGSFSLGAPITLFVCHFMGIPTATLPFEIAGGVSMVVGCTLVLVSGYQFRKNVEVQIDLERE